MSDTQEPVGIAGELFEAVRNDPIVSPHGHCDPSWFAENLPFADPAELLIIPDHYLFRMLYSQGIPMEALGIGVPAAERDPRRIFRLFAENWHLFLGTPSRVWLTETLAQVFGIVDELSSKTADSIYDRIAQRLSGKDFLPRALFEAFNIEILATTDSATDDLHHHDAILASGWDGRIIPTFRPDAVLDPNHDQFEKELKELGEQTGKDVRSYEGYLDALRARRQHFIDRGATASDHAIERLRTDWLSRQEIEELLNSILAGNGTRDDAERFYGHMLVEMAQMSVEDGLVMQIHAGSRRNTNSQVMGRFGRDMGADMPVATDWVTGLEPLLNRVGNDPRFGLIVFTLDESTYARELAPMAGHWPSLLIGPPWWFHDSPAGFDRYFDQVVETAGYHNLAGFNDDTRAFLSIPARHQAWREGVARHLGRQVTARAFGKDDAHDLAKLLSTGLARKAYRLGEPGA